MVFKRAVLGLIWRLERGIIFGFGAEFARLFVGIEPVENGIGDILGHAGQVHQKRSWIASTGS